MQNIRLNYESSTRQTGNRNSFRKSADSYAEHLIQRKLEDFESWFLVQIEQAAIEQGAEKISETHVQNVWAIVERFVKRSNRHQDWQRALAIFIGGSLFSAFVPGFITGLETANLLIITVYTVLGIFGLLITFWGLRR